VIEADIKMNEDMHHQKEGITLPISDRTESVKWVMMQ
jgi:hypothetical protein